MRIHRPLLAAVASVLVITSCGSSGDSSADPTDAPATTAAPADTTPATTAAPTDTAASPETDPAAGSAEVVMSQSRFEPTEIQVAPGDTVTFVNTDPFAHTVTATDESPMEFNSGEIVGDGTFEVTFDEAGTFDYFCQIHPTMQASVVVG